MLIYKKNKNKLNKLKNDQQHVLSTMCSRPCTNSLKYIFSFGCTTTHLKRCED